MGVRHDQKGELLHRRLVLGLGAFSAVAVLDGLQNVARAESGGIKLTVLYAKPKDPDAFNKYYLNKHMPLVAKIPGLRRTEVATIRLWCKRQDLARYDVGRAAGGVGMSKLMGIEQLFEGRHFDREVIILCVRWYLRFKLSLRDLVEMMAERGLALAHTTIMRGDTHRSSRSAGSGSPRRSAGHGGWTRHTSKFEANGAISIVPWIGRGGRLTSG